VSIPRTILAIQSRRLIAPLLCLLLAATAVMPAVGQQERSRTGEGRLVLPGAPGEQSRVVGAREVAEMERPGFTDADVRFMQGMIHHHAQALDLTELVGGRTERPEILLLARRIELSQYDEIGQMIDWLRTRKQEIPTIELVFASPEGLAEATVTRRTLASTPPNQRRPRHGHGGTGARNGSAHAGMPGMLIDEQLGRLAAAQGPEFERLFLEYMISHHEGALVMVEELFASEAGGQESETFGFASHVDSDQRIEILRMRRLLNQLQDN
jgi:uncharacterized protein (DUF305 family)